jgi:integrase
MTNKELRALQERKKIEAMKKVLQHNKRDLLMFVLGVNCGLRISDILSLEVNHILTDKGKPKEFFELREKKTDKYRRIVLAENVQKGISDYMKGYEGEMSRPLFISRKKDEYGQIKALTRQQAYNILNEAAKTVGINEAIGCHSLRKTFGYWAYKSGTDIVLLQQIFNHSAPSVTLRYIGIIQDDIDNVIIKLNL